MLKGININQRVEFASKEDDSTPKTIFVIKPLSGMDRISLASLLEGDNGTERYLNETIRKSLVEIKNPDINDADEAFNFVSNLSMGIITELLEKIKDKSEMSREEEKN